MKDNRKKILISLLIVIVFSMLSISIYYWYQNMHYVSTDDARITGDLVKISPKGTGKLIDISMDEGESVLKNQILARQEIEDQNPEKTIIRAPQDGVIIKTQANIGETYAPGQVLGYIVDPSKLYINANIEEKK